MRRSAIYCTIALVFLSAAASASTYTVHPDGSGDYPTVQAAIDAAMDGDVVELSDGTFTGDGNRDIDYLGKAITVRSQSGCPVSCIIDCGGSAVDPHRGLFFHSGEGPESILESVTVTNGYVTGAYPGPCCGGGMACDSTSSPFIGNCRFVRNQADAGGAVHCEQGSPWFTDCTFDDNSALSGGGVYCGFGATPRIETCVFIDNSATSGSGGGLACWEDDSEVAVIGCTFVRNAASDDGGGIFLTNYASGALENTIIAFSTEGEGVVCASGAAATFGCCDVYGNAGGPGCAGQYIGSSGNIAEDPLFCNPTIDDFHLQDGSPCAPFSPPNEECDLIGAWPVGCLPSTYIIHPDGSGDYATIQDAIDASGDGDVIELTDGMFHGTGNRDLDCLGKEITIRSQSGDPWTCTINCGYMGRGFNFHSGEDQSTVVDGITIAYGFGVNDGLGIRCGNSSPWIRNCRIVDNGAAEDRGGGIYCLECSPRISDCTIARNSAQYGGGIYCREAAPLIERCVINDNYAVQQGGGVSCHWYANPTFVSCTFNANDVVGSGGAVCCSYSSDPHLAHCILAFSVRGEGLMCVDGGSEPTLVCCDIYGNPDGDWIGCIAGQLGQTGNISLDPLFCSPEDGELALAEDSPCAPFTPPNPGCDLIGARPVGCAPMDIRREHSYASEVSLELSISPNPLVGSTQISFESSHGFISSCELTICDLAGRQVWQCNPRPLSDHAQMILWDGSDDAGNAVASGIYFMRLRVGDKTRSRTCLVAR